MDELVFQKHSNPDDANLKKLREDLQNRIDILRKQADVSIRFFKSVTEVIFCHSEKVIFFLHIRITMIRDLS